jgi:hypothetical protein
MGITTGRWTRLAALGIGVATAATVSLATAGSALADATDGTGSATITISTKLLAHLASWGIVAIPETPAISSDNNGADAFTFTVTGGDGSDTNFSGDVDLGGGLTLIDGITHKSVQLTNLKLDYFDGVITAVPAGTTKTIPILDLAGSLSSDNGTGSQTFGASQLTVDPVGAAYLNKTLKSTSVGKRGKTRRAFTPGATTISKDAFTITYTVTIT